MEFRRGGRGGGGGERGGGRGHGGGEGGGRGRGRGGGGSDGHRGGEGGSRSSGHSAGHGGGSLSGRGGGGAPPMLLNTPDPYSPNNHAREIEKHGKYGWLKPEQKADLNIQKYTGPPAKWALNKINVSVNHFLVEPYNQSARSHKMFPIPNLYHYDINYELVRPGRYDADGAVGGGDGEKVAGSDRQGRFGSNSKRKWRSDKDSPSPRPVDNLSQQLEETGLDKPSKNGRPPVRKLPKHLTKAILDYLIPKLRRGGGHHAIATDGNFNLYTTKKLEEIPIKMEWQVTFADLLREKLFDEDDNATAIVTFTPSISPSGEVHAINTGDIARFFESNGGSLQGFHFSAEMRQTLEAACNAFVKSMPNFEYFSVGRSTMVPCENTKQMALGRGLMAWKGISANIAMGWKPYLNVDIANCAFILDKEVLEVLKEIVGERDQKYCNVNMWKGYDFDEVRSLLKTCKIRYKVPGMVRGGPIRDVLKESVSRKTFVWANEETGQQKVISVFDYYKERYGYSLQHRNGPLLEIRKQGTYVPAELCTVKAGQSYNRKLDGPQTTNMLEFAKTTPQEKVKDIYKRMEGMNLPKNPVIQQLGIQVSNKMLNIKEARVLVPPSLRYGEAKGQSEGVAHINPQGGTWDIWRSNTEFGFYKGATINKWGVLVTGSPRIGNAEVDAFVKCLKKNSDRKGVVFKNRPVGTKLDKTDRRYTSPEQNAKDFAKYFSQDFQGCDLVLVVIPDKGHPLYGHVKHAAEVDVGMLTQCVIKKHLFKLNDSVVQNIIKKINTKMNGINHVTVKPILEPAKAQQFCTVLLDCPVMILGADVTHAPPGSKKVVNGQEFTMPSYAAVTGSLDPTCMPFMTEVRAQRKQNAGAAEVIQDLKNIVKKMLDCYKETWKENMPRKIIYFRDGVGEGQFAELLHIEMKAIREACKEFGNDYQPKITFITVQKRHKTRMFHNAANGKIENVPAGTVVDTEIVHSTETDFYLCSHKGMLGTSRPSRYHVLWDDSEFTHDELQSLAYTLCYMYARCTKSVKMPAATYYAHLAADRAKKLCEGFETKFGEPNETNLNRILERSGLTKYPMHFI